ncbi:hypothetical protein [Amycolatopsis sp. cg9]|uniref:hypothetical protein n=1 Tax=Amycolatopsis sp. cg9 TaxID=3238801 RepID=UPI003526115D
MAEPRAGGEAGSTSNAVTGAVDGIVFQAHDIGSVTINQSVGPRRHHRAASVDDRLAGVRAKVFAQWQHEVGNRGLRQPRPVRLRWRSADRPIEVSGPWEPVRGALGHDVTDSLPAAHELVEAFRAGSRQQLVVLGAPGAGKTTLAILYTLAAAAHRDHPVPFLLSIAGWRPRNPGDATGEPIETWVARRISDDHPELAIGADGLRRLWAGKRLLPVLDGLDELPESMLAHALADLDRSAGAGLDTVLTCRTIEYERGFAGGNALSHAAVVDIEPVTVDDAAVYLTQREPARSRRWDAAVELMRREPDGPLAAALSTPLMISLARQAYRDPASDPAELTRFATPAAAGQHLLAQFLPSMYPRERERLRSTRWLSFLAHHLRDRVGVPDYEWWRLSRSVPTAVIATTIVAIGTALGALLTPTLALVLGSSQSFTQLLLPGVVIGLVVGVVAAPRSAPTATADGRVTGPRLLSAVGSGVARDTKTVLTATAAISATALGIGYLVAKPAAVVTVFAVVGWLRELWAGRSNAGGPTLSIIVVVLGVITVTNALGALHGGLPRRSAPRLRLLAPSLAVGLAIGMTVALPFLALGLASSIRAGTGFGLWALVAGSVGVPIGLARWLATPAEHQESSSPQNLLRWDRRALLITVAATAVFGAGATALASLTFPAKDQPPLLPISLVVGVVIGGVVLIGSGAAWLTYTVARGWLAVTGRLPWRLNRFLANAHAVGVLRQTGPAYQLRHDLLTDHLADQWRPAQATAGARAPHRPVRRRWRKLPSLAVPITSIALLAGLIPAIYAANAPHLMDGPVTDGRGMVLSLDGRTLAAFDSRGDWPTVRLWDVRSGRLKATLATDPSVRVIAGIGLNADGTELTLITGDAGEGPLTGSVWRWRTDQDLQARRLPGAAAQQADSTVVVSAFSPDGNTVAIGRRDGTVQLWDLAGDRGVGQRIQPYGPATPAVRNLAYSVDGRSLAILLDDGSVAAIDVTTRTVTRTLPAGTIPPADDDSLQLFGIGNDAHTVAAVDGNGVAALWNLDSGVLLRQFGTGRTGFTSVALSSDGSTVAIGDDDGTIELRDLATGDVTGTLWPADSGVRAYYWRPDHLVFGPADRSLAAASTGDFAQVWDTPMAPAR